MTERPNANANQIREEPSRPASPTWWLVFSRELSQLWIGGRALNLTLIFSILLGIYAYVMASDSVLSLIPPQEMVYEMVKAAMVASVFVGVIIGADSLSGERERATLESLLLTPTSRRQIVVGKFLAAVSPWPVALAITVPYLTVLSQGNDVLGPAIFWGSIFGTILVTAFTALGMFVSFWCNTNKMSMFVSLGLYVLFLVPTQLPGSAQAGSMGLFFQWVNPMQAPNFFLARILVNNRTLDELWSWLTTPVVFGLLTLMLLFWYAGPHLRLEPGRARGFRWSAARAAGFSVIAFAAGQAAASPALAQDLPPQQEQAPPAERTRLQVSIDLDSAAVRAGSPIRYKTRVTNADAAKSPPLVVAMNIINLKGSGDPVDPEDWSPQRTQYLESLDPGASAELSWLVNAILDGDFMVYMVVIPVPTGPQTTSHPVVSSGIHLTVTPFTRLNPGGVLPYAIGGPIVILVIILATYRLRRRGLDTGGAS